MLRSSFLGQPSVRKSSDWDGTPCRMEPICNHNMNAKLITMPTAAPCIQIETLLVSILQWQEPIDNIENVLSESCCILATIHTNSILEETSICVYEFNIRLSKWGYQRIERKWSNKITNKCKRSIELTIELAQGKNMASVKSPRRGPPTTPKMDRANWRIRGPMAEAANPRPTVTRPNTKATQKYYYVSRLLCISDINDKQS